MLRPGCRKLEWITPAADYHSVTIAFFLVGFRLWKMPGWFVELIHCPLGLQSSHFSLHVTTRSKNMSFWFRRSIWATYFSSFFTFTRRFKPSVTAVLLTPRASATSWTVCDGLVFTKAFKSFWISGGLPLRGASSSLNYQERNFSNHCCTILSPSVFGPSHGWFAGLFRRWTGPVWNWNKISFGVALSTYFNKSSKKHNY